MAANIYGHRVVTFRDFSRPCYLDVVYVFQNNFAAIDYPPRNLRAATNRVPKFHLVRFLWDFENCRKWSNTLPELQRMMDDDADDIFSTIFVGSYVSDLHQIWYTHSLYRYLGAYFDFFFRNSYPFSF